MPNARLRPFTASPAAVTKALDALRERYEIPAVYPADALAEAEAAATAWQQDGPARFLADGATDARDLPLVTIDPPGSMDLDQAVHIVAAPADGVAYRVHYAIASLATFVTPGGALDTELRARGETVYAPDHITPLHPEALSHGAASLLPDEERPACLWSIDLDDAGAVLSAHVERALVRSRARLTYGEVQTAYDQHSPLPASVPADMPQLLAAVGKLRVQQEIARGGISLSTPEQEIEQTDNGFRLVYRATMPAEEWNAQISLLTGMCAAQIMVDAGVGILRTMPAADDEDLARMRRVARALRVDWPADVSYPDLVRSLDSHEPAEAAFMQQAIGLFRGAGYDPFGIPTVPGLPEVAIHGAIAARYAHVTAPLRRLVDRYGEEICLAACAGQPIPQWVLDALVELPETMASTGKRARRVSNGAVAALEALVLIGHEGESFDGVITSVRKGRGEVVLASPAVVGDIKPQGDQWLPVGEDVQVRLESADPVKGRANFRLED